MKKLSVLAVACFAAVAAQAQSSNFAGWSAGANLNFANASTEISSGGSTARLGEPSQSFGVQGAYGFALNPTTVLTVGASYNLGEVKAGSGNALSNTYDLKGKEMLAVYVEPGFAVSNSALAYAKVAYLSMKGEERVNAVSGSSTLTGTGLGAGVRVFLNKQVYLQTEFMHQTYDSRTVSGASYKPSATLGTVGLGYKF